MPRLTEAQKIDRSVREADFQRQVTDLATIYGWLYVHFRPAQTQRGWRTPVEGPMGKGWPDLVLVRERDKRLLFAELKREIGAVTYEQAMVLESLGEVAEVHVWRPSDLDRIAVILR